MDPADYIPSARGHLEKGLGRFGFWYFEPSELPRRLELTEETVFALSEADTALGRLAGASRRLPDPHIFIRPYVLREAVASSRIEGTQTSLPEVLQNEAAGTETPGDDVEEVLNYIAAMEKGLDLLDQLPLSLRLVREVHRVLLQGVRGRERQPGEFRRSPVWIGSPNDSPETADFVPPLPDLVPDLLADWERFVHERIRMPVLVQCALLHYQFETIHPFLDGNGRLGRLLIVFFLIHEGRLDQPSLYLSAYFETYRREYYDRLQAVRERDEIQEWLQFFLGAVAAQAEDAAKSTEQLLDLREAYRRDLADSRSRAAQVVDLMLVNPYVTTQVVAERLNITAQGATYLIRQIESKGWLREVGTFGRGGRRYWVAHEILDVIQGGPTSAQPLQDPSLNVQETIAPSSEPSSEEG